MPHNREVGAAGKVLGDGDGGVKIEDNMPPAPWNPTKEELSEDPPADASLGSNSAEAGLDSLQCPGPRRQS